VAAATDNQHFLHAAGAQRFQGVVRDVGERELVRVAHENARDVKCDIAISHDDGSGAGQIRRHLLKMRVSVVPANEIDGSDAAR
jgi:hypothetical protein